MAWSGRSSAHPPRGLRAARRPAATLGALLRGPNAARPRETARRAAALVRADAADRGVRPLVRGDGEGNESGWM